MALDVVVRMTAQEAGVYRAWAEQQKGAKDTAKAMGGVTKSARDAKGTFGEFFTDSIARWAVVGTAIGGATTAIRALIAANKELQSEQAETTFKLDEVFRKFQLQGQLSALEAPAAQKQLFQTAKTAATPVEVVSEAARQLVSSGFETKEVLQGGAARELVEAMKASAEGGKDLDVRQLTESITQFILAQQKPADRKLTRENLQQALRATQGLFLRRNVQFSDLGELAKAAPALSRAGIDPVSQIAMFTKMRDTLDPEESGTALRNIISRLATAGASKEKTAALAQIGLKPSDVDFEGEDAEKALKRMKAGLKKISPAQQAIVLKKIFEERGGLGASTLIENVEDVAKYRAEATDAPAFEKARRTATSGPAAAKTRLELEKQEQRMGGQGARDELMATGFETLDPKHPIQGKIAASAYRWARYFGMNEGWAASFAQNNPGEALKVERHVKYLQSPNVGRKLTPEGEISETARKRLDTAIKALDSERAKHPDAAAKRAADRTFDQVFGYAQRRRYVMNQLGVKAPITTGRDRGKDEAAFAAYAVQAGVVPELKPSQLPKFELTAAARLEQFREHERARTGKETAHETRAEFERLLLQVLLEIAANTADKKVEIKNPGEAERRARRAQPAGPPTASLGR